MKKIFILLMGILLFSNCKSKSSTKPIEKYKGLQVVDKHKWGSLTLKSPDTIIYIKVLQYDYERYNVGDTIK